MSSSLTYRPTEIKTKTVSDEIKYALRKRNEGNNIHNMELDNSDLSYLQGLSDAGIKGVAELIEAIMRHGSITLNEEY